MQCQYWRKGLQCPREATSEARDGKVCRGHMSSFTRARNNERRQEMEENELADAWGSLGIGYLGRTEFGDIAVILGKRDIQAISAWREKANGTVS